MQAKPFGGTVVCLLCLGGSAIAQNAETTEPVVEAGPSQEGAEPSSWFRIDTDALATQLWVGSTHSVGPVDIASDVYVVGSVAELDIGPTFSIGDLGLTAMLGVAFDFAQGDVATLVAPQLFAIFNTGQFYVETWTQFFFSSPLDDEGQDLAYVRAFALYRAADGVLLGPQAEITSRLAVDMADAGVQSLPVGGRVNLSYGAKNTLGIFLGYETKAPDTSMNVAGRLTLIRQW